LPRFSLTLFKKLQKVTLDFLTSFLLGNRAILRDDYQELALITLLYLGGMLLNEILIYAPGVHHHHARWMGKNYLFN